MTVKRIMSDKIKEHRGLPIKFTDRDSREPGLKQLAKKDKVKI